MSPNRCAYSPRDPTVRIASDKYVFTSSITLLQPQTSDSRMHQQPEASTECGPLNGSNNNKYLYLKLSILNIHSAIFSLYRLRVDTSPVHHSWFGFFHPEQRAIFTLGLRDLDSSHSSSSAFDGTTVILYNILSHALSLSLYIYI